MSDQICVKVPQVIGIGTCKVLLVTDIPLTPPGLEIKDIKKKVFVKDWHVCSGQVVIDGHLWKDINYKTLDPSTQTPLQEPNGTVVVSGDVRHMTATIPFDCFIDIPGALPDDKLQVESKEVTCEKDELTTSTNPATTPPTYTNLHEKSVVCLVVKVTREAQITVTPDTPSICPTAVC